LFSCRADSAAARSPSATQLEASPAENAKVQAPTVASWEFESPGVTASVQDWLSRREHPWFVDGWGLNRRVSSSLAWISDGELHASVSVSRGFTGTDVEFRIRCDEQGEPRVAVRVRYWDDASAPTFWRTPIGHVQLSVSPWIDGAPRNFTGFMLGFDLFDVSGARPEHVQGLVRVTL